MNKPAPPAGPGAWLELPAEPLQLQGRLYLPEHRNADGAALLDQLRGGDYLKPFVLDDGSVRRLHFGLDYVQSEMRIANPDELRLAYTRLMTAFLLFVPRPRHVVIVGLGGGSLTRFCRRALPQTRITTLEIDADVIAFGPLLMVPAADTRLQIQHADAAHYFATAADSADVVLSDGCDRHGVAAALCNEDYYRSIHSRLRPGGMLVANLVGSDQDIQAHLRHIAGAFSGRVMVLDVGVEANQLAFVFRNPAFRPDWDAIMTAAKSLQKAHGLTYPLFARRLRHSRQFQAMAQSHPRRS